METLEEKKAKVAQQEKEITQIEAKHRIPDGVLDVITKEVMEDYERLRQLGPVNMLDVNGAMNYANLTGMDHLAELSHNEYMHIIRNFGLLMTFYDISQEPQFG